ncbi:hypothetical protein A9219_000001, partial [Salmonella enterica subsp. enterica serovar Glostrup]|nr:hypothetical protein [Salmonella enterica subsp. enterica serovar Glostrup]
PQPEAHGRRKFNDRLSMNQQPRRALSCCPPPTAVGITAMPDAHPCPAHALHLTRGEFHYYQPYGG